MIVGYIPARGGSKRIPRKNIVPLCGKPLVAHTIEFAQNEVGLDELCLSTDDPEIAQIGNAYGVRVFPRGSDISGDKTPTVEVARDVIRRYREISISPTVLVTLQATCPFRPAGLIQKGLTFLKEANRFTSVVGVSRDLRKSGVLKSGTFIPRYPVGTRSQDLDELYYENGLIYLTPTTTIESDFNLFGETPGALIIDPPHALVDIDDPWDLEIAECLMTSKNFQ